MLTWPNQDDQMNMTEIGEHDWKIQIDKYFRSYSLLEIHISRHFAWVQFKSQPTKSELLFGQKRPVFECFRFSNVQYSDPYFTYIREHSW